MFSGIIKAVAEVKSQQQKNSGLLLTIQKPKGWKISPGDSICTSGVCLTVKKINSNSYLTELMPETVSKTYLGEPNCQYVNLEQSVRYGDVLGGHMVTGHVDAIGKILKIQKRGATQIFKISTAPKFFKYLVKKGSIGVDGISLTVVDAVHNDFTVSIVDYTLKNTTMGTKKVGDQVHLEFDILAKYLEKLVKKK